MHKDIKTLIFETIADDATFKTLTGGGGVGSADPRLYQQFPAILPDHESKPWATYKFITSGVAIDTGDITDPNIITQLDIWAWDSDAAEDVATRIQALLDRKKLTATSHRLLWTRLDGANDLAEDQPNMHTIYHKNVRYLTVGVFQT